MKTIKYTAKTEDEGKRIDSLISEVHPETSRSRAQKLVESTLVNENPIKKNYKVCEGDEIQIEIHTKKDTQLKGIKKKLDIVYKDRHILVINKPPGLPVHPDKKKSHEETLVNILIGNKVKLSKLGGDDRPGIVHRLDMDTSGLIIIAKTDKAYASLRNMFTNRKVNKKYTALVVGNLKPSKGEINAPIGRDPHNRKRMSIKSGTNAKESITLYKVISTFKLNKSPFTLSLLEVKIPTGRTHQIRVHMSAINYPIIGDETYGNPKPNAVAQKAGLKRQFLHASELEFEHPISGKTINLKADLPEDLQNFYKKLTQI